MRLAIISIAVAITATNGVAQSPSVRAATDLTDISAVNDRLFRGIRSLTQVPSKSRSSSMRT